MNRSDSLCGLPPAANATANVAAPLRATGCPSLRRIVQAKDGGICRIKLPCGVLGAFEAQAIADIALRYAGNVVEITNRSNLQLRGVDATHVGELTAALIDIGLGSVDDGSDEVRNVMVSPMAGLDPEQIVDTTALAEQLLSLLQTEKRFHELSAKFAVLLDGGEHMAMLEHPHDLWLSAMRLNSQVLFAFGLAGAPPVNDSQPSALAAVEPKYALDLIEAVLHQFLDVASLEQTRMRQLLRQISVENFLHELRQRVNFPLIDDTHIKQWRRTPAATHAHIGVASQRDGKRIAVGAVPALGRLDGFQLRNIAEIAAIYGDGSLRLTPWQSLLLPNIDASLRLTVLQQLQALGLGVSNGEPLAHLIACSGSSGCAKGLADTKADALQLAELIDDLPAPSMDVHLSGCSRSCAAAHTAPFTLLAVKPGRYDLYRKLTGASNIHTRNSDAHNSDTHDFGTCIASDIGIDEAAGYLRQSTSERKQ